MGGDPDAEQDASRLKTICETKFKNSNLKSALKYAKKAHRLAPNLEGISSMLTAFKILRVASKSSTNATTDWYKILQVEPFSHINTIKKQYKKLALILHPDKNSHLGCEEAFKLVGEGFRVLSDKIRRKEYDMRLRIRIQEENVNGLVGKDAFWTACSRCRLLHQFERKYLGHNLVCPSCNKSFEAVEVEGVGVEKGEESDGVRVFRSERLRRKMGSVGSAARVGSVGVKRKMSGGDAKGKESGGDWSGGRLRRRMSTVGEVLARSKPKSVEDREILESLKPKRAKVREETMTLAQMQLEAKRRANQEKLKLKMKEKEKEKGMEKKKEKDEREKERETGTKEGETETGRRRASKNQELEIESQQDSEKSGDSELQRGAFVKKSVDLGTEKRGALKKSGNSEIARKTLKNCSLAIDRRKSSKSEDLEIMAVEDSDFYDFDKDRVERSFKKGQVWAIYDDDDGMPRHYGLIDEAISVYPFEVKISWLDLQNNGDEQLICWERMGFHVSCGRFKVSRKTSIDSLNIFSHVMDCERVAREIYRIYPKKGSVWALYNEAALGVEGGNLPARDRRSYDIVVFLTTYSEMHGLSMAYLEKVDGFKTIFKRREIGCHAIRWLEKDDVRLFSHQIPARKLTGDEVSDLLKDCWELDPASLPSDLLAIGWGR
ncbi:J protein JJJ2 [Pistacia vera]|uniref:J protein JJJ2 n=1 Tax=Pistacia vera TaxID=55513 RepID=UPI0012636601|nr:J protein JJJ2 [Pistacia vera]